MNPKLGFALQALTLAMSVAAQNEGDYGGPPEVSPPNNTGDYGGPPEVSPPNDTGAVPTQSEPAVTSAESTPIVSPTGGTAPTSAETTESVPVVVTSAGGNVTETTASPTSSLTTESVPVIISTEGGNTTHANTTMTSTVPPTSHVETTSHVPPTSEVVPPTSEVHPTSKVPTTEHGGVVPTHSTGGHGHGGCIPIPVPVPTTEHGGGGVSTPVHTETAAPISSIPVSHNVSTMTSSAANNLSTLTSSIVPTSHAPVPIPTEATGEGPVGPSASKVSAAFVGAGLVAMAFFAGL